MQFTVASQPGLRVLSADLGLACCAVEFASAVTQGLLVRADPADPADPADRHVLVVSGTLTRRLEPTLLAMWEAAPKRAILALGACATSGGPYWDSYAVTPGISAVVPVAGYVPGCPPRPDALVDAICALGVSA